MPGAVTSSWENCRPSPATRTSGNAALSCLSKPVLNGARSASRTATSAAVSHRSPAGWSMPLATWTARPRANAAKAHSATASHGSRRRLSCEVVTSLGACCPSRCSPDPPGHGRCDRLIEPVPLLAAGQRVLQDEPEAWCALGYDEDLVGEQRLAGADQQLVQRQGGSSRRARPQGLRERRGDPAHLLDPATGVEERAAQGAEGEQAGVRPVQ